MHKNQQQYFKKLDKHEIELPPQARQEEADEKEKDKDEFKVLLRRCKEDLQVQLVQLKSSRKHIVEAAIAMLRKGLFLKPHSTDWNSQQCLGFLLHAYLLQQRKNVCNDLATDPLDVRQRERWDSSIFTGAAGTGKTALLLACDVLTETFFGENSVVKSAPTRTAARLNNGDTCHGAWKLPFSSCLGPSGRLSAGALKSLQVKLVDKEESSLDEISMLSPERYYQIDCRVRQGTGRHDDIMGKLKD